MPAKSKSQQQAAAIALHAPKSELRGASKKMASSMSRSELDKFASTKRGGLPKKVQTEGQRRIETWLLERGAHKKGCSCGFCKNKGNIANHWKKKLEDAAGGKKDDAEEADEKEPKGMTEGLMPAIKKAIGETNVQGSQVKLSKGSTIGKANRAFTNMTSKQQDTPGLKPQMSMKAEAEATNQVGRMRGFKIKGEGETTSGKPLPKTRAGESAQRIVRALIGS